MGVIRDVMPAFELFQPTSVDAALELLDRHGSSAMVLAGGLDSFDWLKDRIKRPSVVVDLSGIAELKGIRPMGDGLEIGAMTTYAEWQAATTMPAVAEAIELIADVQVRNRGTNGGSIAHADPGADMPAIALAFDGSAVLRGPGGERVVPLRDFFKGTFETDIRPGEILVAIRRGPVPAGAGFAYRKLPQPASGYAIVGGELVFQRTLRGLRNTVLLPRGWEVSGVSQSATIGTDRSGRAFVALINLNAENNYKVTIRAKRGA